MQHVSLSETSPLEIYQSYKRKKKKKHKKQAHRNDQSKGAFRASRLKQTVLCRKQFHYLQKSLAVLESRL